MSSVLFKAPSGESSKLSPMHTSPWKSTNSVRRATLTSLSNWQPLNLALTLKVNTDEQSTTQGEYQSYSLWHSLRCMLRKLTIPTQVLVESMECHSLYQEERLHSLPYWYSCSILRLQSRVEKHPTDRLRVAHSALLHFGTILLLIISARLM